MAKSGLWQDREFLKLWSAQTVSALGSRITRTALPIVAVLMLSAPPTEIGILSAVSVAPAVFVGLLLGGWIDRSKKRNILIGADLVRGVLLITIPMAAWFGSLTVQQLYFVAGASGALTVIFQIADHAYLPALIGYHQLVEGNAKLQTTDAVAEVGGPSAAGVLIRLVTAPFTILLDAISFFASAGLLAAIRKPEPAKHRVKERGTLVRDFGIGFRSGFGNYLIRPLFLVEANGALFGGFFLTLYMLFTLKTLGLSPATVGLLVGLGGIGGMLGAAVARRAEACISLGPAIFGSITLGAVANILIPLASGRGPIPIGLLATHQVVGDGAMVAYAIYASSLRQTVIPQGEIGRTTATLNAASGLLLTVGALFSGWLAFHVGVRTVVWVGAIGGLLGPLIIALSPIHRLSQMPSPISDALPR